MKQSSPAGKALQSSAGGRVAPLRSLVAKLTLFVGLMLAMLIAVLLAANDYLERRILREEIHAHLSSVAASRRDMVLAHISQLKQRAELLASHGEYRQLFFDLNRGLKDTFNEKFSQGTLDALVDRKMALSAALVEVTGRVLISSNGTQSERKLSGDPAFENGMNGPHVGLPRQIGDRFEVVISAPILNFTPAHETIGVIVMTVDVSALAAAVRDTTGLGQTGEVLLGVREDERVHLLFPPRDNDAARAIQFANVPAMSAALDGRRFFGTTRDYRGEPVLAASLPIGYGGWALVAKMDEREAYAPIAREFRGGLLCGGVVAAVGIIAAFLLAHGVTRPVHRLVRAASRVAGGDYETVVPVRSADEFSVLSARFNDMTAAIRTREIERRRAEEALEKINQQLEHTVIERTSDLGEAFTALQKEIAERQRLESEILQTTEREQRRLGQDLHDDLGQKLVAVGLLAHLLSEGLRAESHPMADDSKMLSSFLKDAINSARGMAKSFYPVELERGGLLVALEDLAVRTEALAKIQCAVIHESAFLCGKDAEIHLYRIVQESIANAIKHGSATRIIICCSVVEGTSTLSVTSDGFRFEKKQGGAAGMGLHLFKYRARLIGAEIDVRAGETGGCIVRCSLENKPVGSA